MNRKRVVVTGLGQISPVGNTVQSAWETIISAKSGISHITRFDSQHIACHIAGEVRNFEIQDYVEAKTARQMDLFIQYGVAAAFQAIEDSGIESEPSLDRSRVGVVIGSGIGGLSGIENTVLSFYENTTKRISPFFIPSVISNLLPSQVSILKGFTGPAYGLVSACTTGTHCIGDSMILIQSGRLDVAICGGSEAPISPVGVSGFSACKALSMKNEDPKKASRPWDKGRDGFVIGEGAGVIVLEEYEHAKKRGAKIYAELVGYGMSSDAYHITAPLMDGSGPSLGMKNALRDAQINPDEVQYINAHGTSTSPGDIAETVAIKNSFKEHAYNLVVSSTKSMTGHLLGGAGGIEAVFTVLSIDNQISPPTINIEEQDYDNGCDLDYCANESRDLLIKYALSNSFGFGGTNGTLIFKKFD